MAEHTGLSGTDTAMKRCWQCRLCRLVVTGRSESGRDETEEICRRYNQPVWEHSDAEHCEFFNPKERKSD